MRAHGAVQHLSLSRPGSQRAWLPTAEVGGTQGELSLSGGELGHPWQEQVHSTKGMVAGLHVRTKQTLTSESRGHAFGNRLVCAIALRPVGSQGVVKELTGGESGALCTLCRKQPLGWFFWDAVTNGKGFPHSLAHASSCHPGPSLVQGQS